MAPTPELIRKKSVNHPQNPTMTTALEAGAEFWDFAAGVYGYMALGLCLSGAVALGIYRLSIDATGGARTLNTIGQTIVGSPLRWLLLLSPLGFLPVLVVRIPDMTTASAHGVFFSFATAMGVSLSSIMIAGPSRASVVQIFFCPAAAFAGLGFHQQTIRRDPSAAEIFLLMGLCGLAIPGLINYFSHSLTW